MKSKAHLRSKMAGLSAAAWLTVAAVPTGVCLAGGTKAVHAAEEVGLSREEAVKKAAELANIPETLVLQGADVIQDSDGQVWHLRWESGQIGKEGWSSLSVEIDAKTGSLLDYQFRRKTKQESSEKSAVDDQTALDKVYAFLDKAVSAEERKKLSRPNEYGQHYAYVYDASRQRAYTFTRVENGIPFLENGIRIILSPEGDIRHFQRLWDDVSLPDAKGVIGEEAAAQLLASQAKPGLAIVDLFSLMSGWGFEYESFDREPYLPVFLYQQDDAQMVDAISGKLLNGRGEADAKEFVPAALGETVRKGDANHRISREEARKLADEWTKKIAGPQSDAYRPANEEERKENQDGMPVQFWIYKYELPGQNGKQGSTLQVVITDRGELFDFRWVIADMRTADGIVGSGAVQRSAPALTAEQAKERAISFVRKNFPDRLGEIYLDRLVSVENEKYTFFFGWMKEGVPVLHDRFRLTVNAATGTVEMLDGFRLDRLQIELPSAKLDPAAAHQVVQANQKLMLTYFLPEGSAKEKKNPRLVYRYVGDKGVVDAVTGKWIHLDRSSEMNQKQRATKE
ncbi:hypothetical protein KDJ56_05230 [Brevibacillus composti]|uniref:YcdB/YcdC repeated domain-containing protein n=1 Tax=Brevibacillus composti TaxID=2796470 RepID=A0A7T5EMI9_9BACL|nr:YcdB/YcdC domain-containing protein [Brevibacillus composti]QQE75384.1 hypothetical protein JD108_05550 [Brevibacillus composti]QUO42410.1 hypothetical protein KDJ56_05230 [Brevibacillus composti]